MKKTAVVTGAGGFIGSHLVKRLKSEGYWVRGVDLKYPEFEETAADDFVLLDVGKDLGRVQLTFLDPFKTGTLDRTGVDEVYALACLMGGAGFIFSGDNDAEIMSNSAACNINTAKAAHNLGVGKVFYSSSACMYPAYNQEDPDNPNCAEASAYPAAPDSEYGWEKLFSERLYLAFARNYGMQVRIARFHNIYGPQGTWRGGKEKAPAAICRKVLEAVDEIEIWGDGEQTRSFLYIDECVEGIRRLMCSDFTGPVNIGSDEMVTINELAKIAIRLEENSSNFTKRIRIKHIDGPLGVRGRNSDNKLIREKLGWEPRYSLEEGIIMTYLWIKGQIKSSQS